MCSPGKCKKANKYVSDGTFPLDQATKEDQLNKKKAMHVSRKTPSCSGLEAKAKPTCASLRDGVWSMPELWLSPPQLHDIPLHNLAGHNGPCTPLVQGWVAEYHPTKGIGSTFWLDV